MKVAGVGLHSVSSGSKDKGDSQPALPSHNGI